MTNPLLSVWDTPFGLPPFDAISDDDYAPAVAAALTEARANIAAITDTPEPPGHRRWGMFLDGKWYRLTARDGSYPADDPVKGLDAAILQELLLGPVLGIGDPRQDPRIDFVGGIRGLGELEKRCADGWAVAFAMFPTALADLFAVADSGQVMPPKSTWFEPKLRSGLVVHLLDGEE